MVGRCGIQSHIEPIESLFARYVVKTELRKRLGQEMRDTRKDPKNYQNIEKRAKDDHVHEPHAEKRSADEHSVQTRGTNQVRTQRLGQKDG